MKKEYKAYAWLEEEKGKEKELSLEEVDLASDSSENSENPQVELNDAESPDEAIREDIE